MKSKIILFCAILIFLIACKKDDNTEQVTFSDIQISEITANSATVSGEIYVPENIIVNEFGICWNNESLPTTENYKEIFSIPAGNYTCQIQNLLPNTEYYFRAFAITNLGTSYSIEQKITTLNGSDITFNPNISYGTMTDIDGNTYYTVMIGNQTWMAENLKVTHYQNGDLIEHVTDNQQWSERTTGAYCAYQNEPENVNSYGLLYNWYAINDERKIAPEGWRVPTTEDYQILSDYLGSDTESGAKIKEVGTTHWKSPNAGADNASGLTALPGGIRYDDGSFNNKTWNCYFWTATQKTDNRSWYRVLYSDNTNLDLEYTSYKFGLSIRCIKE